MAKLMAPNIRIDWYPEGHFADIQNPTVAELNSGYNLSCAIVTGYTLDFTDSNTVDTTTIFDDFTSESILNHSYEADLQFFLAPRDSIAGNEEAYRKAEELFYVDQNPKGYLAKRFGFPGDSKYVGNQKVDLFLLQADLPKVLSEEDNPVLLNIRFLPQGEAVSGVTVVGHLIKVTAVEPTWKDSPNPYLKGGGTWSTPAVEGVIYDRPSGSARGGETITVSARPKTGYELTGSTSWSHTFPERLPWITYEWEGEPHASPSIKRDHTGNIVARNLIPNPRAENGSYGWNPQDGYATDSIANSGQWGHDSPRMFRTHRDREFNARVRTDRINLSSEGNWLGVSVWTATNRTSTHPTVDSMVEIRFFAPGKPTGYATVTGGYLPYYGGGVIQAAAQIPAGYESGEFDFTIMSRRNGGDWSGVYGTEMWHTKAHLAVGSSEQDALDQVTEYFDGDTPDEYL